MYISSLHTPMLRRRHYLPRQWLRRMLHSETHNTVNYAATPIHPDELTVQIFGSSTEVGKTIISAGLSLAALQEKRKVCYIKPVQTGELDEYFIQLYTNPRGTNDIYVRTLQHWNANMSPYLAARIEQPEGETVISDQDLLTSLQREMRAFVDSAKLSDLAPPAAPTPATASATNPTPSAAPKKKLFMLVETAGGVLSPGPNKTLQADLYRSLRLPVLLVGDARLGGISATLCAYESLRIRGYSVHAIVMIDRPDTLRLGNLSLIQEHLESVFQGVPGDPLGGGLGAGDWGFRHPPSWSLGTAPQVFSLSPLPPDNKALLHGWFKSNEATFHALLSHLRQSVAAEWRGYVIMKEQGEAGVWMPRTAAAAAAAGGGGGSSIFVESAHGDHLRSFRMCSEGEGTMDEEAGDDSLADASSSASGGSSSLAADGQDVPSKTAASDADSPSLPMIRLRPVLTNTMSTLSLPLPLTSSPLSLCLGEAAGRYGHLPCPPFLHPPVVTLTRYLLEGGVGRGWGARVRYLPSAQASVSTALALGIRLFEHRRNQLPSGEGSGADGAVQGVVLTQQGAVSERALAASLPAGYALCSPLAAPLLHFRNGRLKVDVSHLRSDAFSSLSPGDVTFSGLAQLFSLPARLSSSAALTQAYRQHIQTHLAALPPVAVLLLPALYVPPQAHGANGASGGFVDPLFQKLLLLELRRRSPATALVLDESRAGMYRLGLRTAYQLLASESVGMRGAAFDMGVYGDMLGGSLPLFPLITTDEVYEAHQATVGRDAQGEGEDAMQEGWAASPLACSAALEALRLLENASSVDSAKGELASAGSRPGSSSNSSIGTSSGASSSSSSVGGAVSSVFSEEALKDLSKLPGVAGCMALGSILSIHLVPPLKSQRSDQNTPPAAPSLCALVSSLLTSERIFTRMEGAGDTLTLYTTPLTSLYDRQRLLRVLRRCVTRAFYMRPTAPLEVQSYWGGKGR